MRENVWSTLADPRVNLQLASWWCIKSPPSYRDYTFLFNFTMSFLLSFTILPFVLLSAMQGVAGHGYVHSVNIGGQDLPGWNPFNDPCVK